MKFFLIIGNIRKQVDERTWLVITRKFYSICTFYIDEQESTASL